MKVWNGKSVCKGIAMGPVVVMKKKDFSVTKIKVSDPEAEISRVTAAVDQAKSQLQEFYEKALSPYNSANEKYTRFPATLRNLDIMSDIIRRYVSEYFKGIHEFVVGANNPDIVINKNAKLK